MSEDVLSVSYRDSLREFVNKSFGEVKDKICMGGRAISRFSRALSEAAADHPMLCLFITHMVIEAVFKIRQTRISELSHVEDYGSDVCYEMGGRPLTGFPLDGVSCVVDFSYLFRKRDSEFPDFSAYDKPEQPKVFSEPALSYLHKLNEGIASCSLKAMDAKEGKCTFAAKRPSVGFFG